MQGIVTRETEMTPQEAAKLLGIEPLEKGKTAVFVDVNFRIERFMDHQTGKRMSREHGRGLVSMDSVQ